MSLPSTILALRDLVAEGSLTWAEATTELREEFGLDILQCYVNGAIFLFQKADRARRPLIIQPRSFK